MAVKIQNKGAFFVFILVVVILVVGFFYFAYKQKEGENKNDDAANFLIENQQEEANEAEMQEFKEKREEAAKKGISELEGDNAKEYKNQRYKYAIKYPGSWFVDSGKSENDLQQTQLEDGKTILEGAYTLFSNYDNINQFDEENTPEDFHLLGLTVCEANEYSEEALAKNFGSFVKSDEFLAGGLTGKKFVDSESSEKKSHTTIIFKKDDFYYVFKLAFINGITETSKLMEEIVATFSLIDEGENKVEIESEEGENLNLLD